MSLLFFCISLVVSATRTPVPGPARVDVLPTGAWAVYYVSKGFLRVIVARPKGRTVTYSKPRTVCRLWELDDDGDAVELSAAANGASLAVTHYVQQGALARYGFDPSGPAVNAVWLVPLIGDRKPYKIGEGSYAAISPDGTEVAFTVEKTESRNGAQLSFSHVWLYNTVTRRRRLLRAYSEQPAWSTDGKEIAVAERLPGESFDGRALVLDPKSGKALFKTGMAVSPSSLVISPNRRYLAVHNHLSRPLTGHTIWDRKAGKEISLDFQRTGFAPALIWGWSPDSRRILVDWRVPDPNNDGNWRRDYVGIVSMDGREKRTIGSGINGAFSPDGSRVIWLQSQGTFGYGVKSLVCAPAGGGKTVTLVRDVDAFALTKPWVRLEKTP